MVQISCLSFLTHPYCYLCTLLNNISAKVTFQESHHVASTKLAIESSISTLERMRWVSTIHAMRMLLLRKGQAFHISDTKDILKKLMLPKNGSLNKLEVEQKKSSITIIKYIFPSLKTKRLLKNSKMVNKESFQLFWATATKKIEWVIALSLENWLLTGT